MKRREFLAMPAVLAMMGAGDGVLPPRKTDFAPRAKQLLFVFLTGGFSHVDTFDPKPKLREHHGKVVSAPSLRDVGQQPLMGSPFDFRRCGRSGLAISELFPNLGTVADELCVIRSLHTDIVEHFQAVLAMHTGSATVPLPSIGAWLSHGLGTFNASLPSYMVLCEHLPYAGSQVWDASFLPPIHQGVRILPGKEPIPDLRSPSRTGSLAELERALLREVNERHAKDRAADGDLRARTDSLSTAQGLMREAPEVFDLSMESDATLKLYGLARGDASSFAAQCLTARRLVERGVRVVELIDTGSSDNWDSHGDMQAHRPKALRVDRAIAGLLADLRRTGLLDSILVAICTEFGRTPWTDNAASKGRNHFAKAFTCLLAGAGVRKGHTHGETDEYGASIVKDPVHVHDYHATILHLMGVDHEKLTYRFAGRDFRLTDVDGRVVKGLLA